MKTALLKDILREIRHSLPRFLSITLMISLGVFVYSGLKGAAPLMRNTLNDFTAKTNMADLKIETVFGLERKDLSLILSDHNIKTAEFHYSVDLNVQNSDLLIQLQSMPKAISLPLLTEGRYPTATNEILLDADLAAKGYQIGDRIAFKKENNKLQLNSDPDSDILDRYQFKVVGFCYHPEFTQPNIKGEATGGLGKLDGFAFVSEKNFNSPNYHFSRLRYQTTGDRLSEDPVYKEITGIIKENLSHLLENRPQIRLRDLRKKTMDKIRENEAKLVDADNQLSDAANRLHTAKKALIDGEDQLNVEKEKLRANTDAANSEIEKALNQLNLARTELDNSMHIYLQNKEELNIKKKEYQIGITTWQKGKLKLEQEKRKLSDNHKQIQDGIIKIDNTLNNLISSEKELLSGLAKFGIAVEIFKQKVQAALQTGNPDLLEAMGEAAVNYASILQARQELTAKKETLLENNRQIEAGLQAISVQSDQLAATEAELTDAKQLLDQGEEALSKAKEKLDKGEADYTVGMKQLQISKDTLTTQLLLAYQKIEAAENELSTARQIYESGKKEFEEKEQDANKKITDGKQKIKDAKKILKALKEPIYKVQTRDDLSQYFIYFDSAKRMEFLANIFPVFFFLIAMLVCLSTMTRMTEEHRSQIGTLKALGYSTWDISKKYFYYGLFSSVLGGIIGVALGQPILSRVVFSAYNDAFVIQKPVFQMSWGYSISSVFIGIACTAFVAFFVVHKHLRQNAAALMRPKAPKSGTKIILERISFVWKRLSFLQKVTARNMFRYKSRMFMAILGISGCTALVFLGFALRDSVGKLLPVQFEELTRYQYLAIYDEDLSEQATKDFRNYMNESARISSHTTLHLESMTWKKTGFSNQNVQILVPQDPAGFAAVQTLRSPKANNLLLTLPKEGAIITDKLAKLANIKAGDTIDIIRDDNRSFSIPIVSVSENYLGHYIYMNKDSYIHQFGKDPIWNAKAIAIRSSKDGSSLVSELLDLDIVLSVTETNFASAEDSLKSLDIVVGIMILLSSLLAFVVLYNLSNINISERMRELSTIKVLGFFPKELTTYVYRETFALGIIGIAIGYVLGILLHSMILEIIVPDAFQLYPKIYPLTYVVSAVMTLAFSLFVMIFVHIRLKKIDMVEALKSYE